MSGPMDQIMRYFREISSIPRCSKDEARVGAWIRKWAEEHQFNWTADDAGNLVIQVPARGAGAGAPTLVLQGHMDMVCEKTPDSPHDFSKDPLTLITDGEWLHADRTTLGADNGIALALAMAVASDESLVHPPLELLFTVDEETGLTGAEKLGENMLTGKILINIDSEEEGVFTVGCAGGQHIDIELALNPQPVEKPADGYEVRVGGLHGGHSGVDIHRNRANANLLLAHALETLRSVAPLRLHAFSGGSAHNAIARDATALVIVPSGAVEGLQRKLSECERRWQSTYAQTDTGLYLRCDPVNRDLPERALDAVETEQALSLILAMPHGVAGLCNAWPGVVETSSNLARVALEGDRLTLLSSVRSSDMNRLDEMTARVCAITHLAGAGAKTDNGYPAWEVDLEANLLARCRGLYADLFAEEPKVAVMHAGLECGVIGAKYPGMEMISIGPTLKFPHSPRECLHLPAVEKVWTFMKALLQDYAAP